MIKGAVTDIYNKRAILAGGGDDAFLALFG